MERKNNDHMNDCQKADLISNRYPVLLDFTRTCTYMYLMENYCFERNVNLQKRTCIYTYMYWYVSY